MMFDMQQAQDRIKAIKANESMSPFRKKMELLPIFKAAKSQADRYNKEAVGLQREIKQKTRFIDVLQDMKDAWGEEFSSRVPAIQKNDVSRLHQLQDAANAQGVFSAKEDGELTGDFPILFQGAKPFVVSHDWASVIPDQEGDIVLPYPHCAFEFRFEGRTVIVIAMQHQDYKDAGAGPAGVAFYQAKTGDWLSLGGIGNESPVFEYGEKQSTYWWNQVRAICIALDAEVASHDVRRAPHSLNIKREKQGRAPLSDFHVVDLSARHRVSRAGSGAGTKKRLHFCRGHWRHFEKSKTWVRWCLKGNADLGFVDKEYRI